ncbi:MAG: hypothetical protein LIO46_04050 [Clostridiales bacterium]|nr:hypothetical protein [Clostridiales bacterium]
MNYGSASTGAALATVSMVATGNSSTGFKIAVVTAMASAFTVVTMLTRLKEKQFKIDKRT